MSDYDDDSASSARDGAWTIDKDALSGIKSGHKAKGKDSTLDATRNTEGLYSAFPIVFSR